MRKYSTLPGIIAVVAAALISFIPSMPRLFATLLLLASLVFFVYWTRGNITYSKAIKALRSQNGGEKAKALFEKALRTGIPPQNAIFASSVLLTEGSNELAAEALQPITEASDPKLRGQAKTALSAHYWFLGEHDEAIKLVESAIYEDGLTDRNAYINICCYYLKEGRTERFRKLVGEVNDKSPAFTHFKAISYIMEGKFREAGILLSSLFDMSSPSYPDPYINYALVYLHYGRLKDAEDLALVASKTEGLPGIAVYEKEFADSFYKALSNPMERLPFAESVNRNTKIIVRGKLPEWTASDTPYTEALSPNAPSSIPDFRSGTIAKEDISTSLTDDDEEWIRSHPDAEHE